QHLSTGGETPGEPAGAYLAERLLAGEKLVGVLVAENRQPAGTFDDRVERILAAGASQIALVLDNLRAKELVRQSLAAAHQRAGDLESLYQAAAAALQQSKRIFGFDRGSVWKREPGIQTAWS